MNGDELLVGQIQGAESEAQRRLYFAELIHSYQAMAYRYSFAILGDAQLAEDATQEAFLTAYQLLWQLREPKAFSGWLRRILQTHSHRLLKEGRRSHQSLEQAADWVAEQSPLQTHLEHLELQEAVRAGIETLPESLQTPVVLHYLEHYSLQEIADTLDISLAAVKKRLERARHQLKERMREMAHEYLESIPSGRGFTAEIFTTLMEAAAVEGQYMLLETLLVEGIDVDEQDADGQTMLHWAARAGHLGAVELLLEYHPDLDRRDQAGRTALQLAILDGHQQVAERLRHAARPSQ
jgi:RNA polymerase sigma-70 factor (ECF subfamily)